MTRAIPFILYLLLIAAHQVFLKDLTTVYTATINLTALMVMCTALYKSELTTTWFGFMAGLVMAAQVPSLLGWHVIVMALLGMAAFHVRERLNLDSLSAKVLLIVGGVFAHNLALLIIGPSTEFAYRLWSEALLGTAYTTFVGWVFFLIKEKRITYRKFKELF